MPNHAERVENHAKISQKLLGLSEEEVTDLLKSGKSVGSSMGAFALNIEGIPVFAKQIAISDVELAHQKPDGKFSTENIFGLPTAYQYAFKSAGFGAGRELAAHAMTTEWALSGECESFPITYGYKMIDRAPSEDPLSEEDFKSLRKYWNDSEAVEARMRGIEGAKKSMVIFMESVPQTLESYMHSQEEERRPDMKKVESGILATTDFMASKGMMHFDAHGKNILVDETGQVRFADFGMVSSKTFDLDVKEREFLEANHGYDRSQALSSLCRHKDGDGKELPILPEVKEVSDRYQPINKMFKEKFSDAFKEDNKKAVTYPAAQMEALYEACLETAAASSKDASAAAHESETWAAKMAKRAGAQASAAGDKASRS